jgi:uncharacterized OB-fold protein
MAPTVPPSLPVPLPPEVTAETRPFWEGCGRGQLLVQRCRACGALQHYPRGVCGTCWATELDWQESRGGGTVYTYTVVHRSQAPGFRDALPYVLAWVQLDEGVQVMTNLVGIDPGAVRIGMRVRVVFEQAGPELAVPRFAPDTAARAKEEVG